MSTHSKDIPVLNGIRALAVIVVFASHASNIFFNGVLTGFGGGQLGVMLFFMLSGFLMAFLYLGKPSTARAQRNFLVNRFARIYPMFLVVVTACSLVNTMGLPLLVYRIKTPGDVLEHLLFIRGDNVLWTVGPEVIFYVLFLALWKARSVSTGLFFIAAIVMACIAWLPMNVNATNSLFALHDKLPYFIVGCLIGMHSKNILESDQHGSKSALTTAFWVSLVVFVASFPQILRLVIDLPAEFLAAPWSMPWTYPFYLAATAALFITAVMARPWILTNRAAGFIGKISFSFYLLHYMVLENVQHLMPTHPLRSIALAAVMTVVLSSLSYFAVEIPMRNLVRRLGKKSEVVDATLLTQVG